MFKGAMKRPIAQVFASGMTSNLFLIYNIDVYRNFSNEYQTIVLSYKLRG